MESPTKLDRQTAVLEEYGLMAQPHIDHSRGRMQLLPIDIEAYPGQGLDAYRIEGSPHHAGAVEIIATSAENRFPEYMQGLQSSENKKIVDFSGEILKSGGNIMLVTNHGDTVDIGLAHAGFYAALDRADYRMKTGMIISKMITRVAYILDKNSPAIPATDALKLICDDVFLSFPRTESMRRSKMFSFIPDHIDNHNRKLRGDIEQRQDEGGYLLAVAGSGTTDKPSKDDENTYEMGQLSQGTIDMMKHPHTLVVPMAVWLKDEKAVFEFCSNPRAVSNEAEAHKVMQDIAAKLEEVVPDKKFVYRNTLGKLATRP